MRKQIYLILISAIFLLSSVSALETISENPTSYSCTNVGDCNLLFDNDWTTYSYNPGGTTGLVLENYTKPFNANSAIWEIKIGISALTATQTGSCWTGSSWVTIFSDSLSYMSNPSRNYTLPQACLNNNLQLKVDMTSAVGKFVYFYEDRIRWNTTTQINVSVGQTLSLPQLNSPVQIDNTGANRTYLYCTWRINGNGQEAFLMNNTLCPSPQQVFTFNDNQDYYVRIDRADIFYNGTGWQIASTGLVGESLTHYQLDIPEPSPSFLTSVYNTIYNTIKSAICYIFPWLGFCS
jgi:hypothetical protein